MSIDAPYALFRVLAMTAAQAASVRYVDPARGCGLDPVPLADGITFVLPVRVLDDPMHAAKRALLASFEQREVMPGEWPQTSADE